MERKSNWRDIAAPILLIASVTMASFGLAGHHEQDIGWVMACFALLGASYWLVHDR